MAHFDEFMWYPAEVDVSIRLGWFYHKAQDVTVRSVDNLKRIYYGSIGGNTMLLLNIPPDTRGLIHEKDVETMEQLGEHIAKSNAQLLTVKEITAPISEEGNEIENVLNYEYDESTYDPISYYTPKDESEKYSIKIQLDGEHKINRVKLVENVAFSQRIEEFEIYAYIKGKRKKVGRNTTVGYGRVAFFPPTVADCVEIVITQSRRKPYLEFIGVYEDNDYQPKKPFMYAFKQWIHRANYRAFINRENKKNKKKK